MQQAVEEFQVGITSGFKALLDKLFSEAQKEREAVWKDREALDQGKAQLAHDREQFEEETKRAAHVQSDGYSADLHRAGDTAAS